MIYRSLALAIVDALQQIFGQHRHAEPIVAQLLKSNPRWGSHDRRFIAEAIYEIVRHPTHFGGIERDNAYWHMLGAWHTLNDQILPEWEEFASISPDEVRQQYAHAQTHRSTRHALPEWLDQMAVQLLGETHWQSELTALDQAAPIFIRVNALKATPQQVVTALAKSNIVSQAVASMPNTLRIEGRKNLTATDVYRKGWIELQDAGSQCIAPFCGVQPGMTVLDACAGAGGKTLHLADLMNNKGTIVAMDTDKRKLAILEQRAQRAGITIIRTRHLNTPKVIDRYRFAADRLLLDVPCSGLGAMRRQPDLKWHLSPQKIAELIALQSDILNRYSAMLHPEGRLIYATCSILPTENEQQIANFLQNNHQNAENKPTFALLQQQYISPADTGFDGFYMAKLKRQ